MKPKKDRSMLWAILAGFVLFVVGVPLLLAMLLWTADPDPVVYVSELPEGTVYDLWEPERSWMGDGVTTLTAQIPTEAAAAFEEKLRSEGYTDGPLPPNLQKNVRRDPDTDIIPDTDDGLWWFMNDETGGPDDWGWLTNYTLCFYHPYTCMYYYIEYDS